ncbi:hypothetical protein Tco_0509038 [Tanacetum coccineum]
MTTGTEFDIEKFDGKNDFKLWQVIGFYGRSTRRRLQRGFEKSQSKHIDEFYKLVSDLEFIDTVISDEDQVLLLLTSLPSSYDNFIETLLYGRDTLKLEDVLATLNSRELQKMTKAKGDGGEGLYVRGRSGQRDIEQGTYSAWSKSQGRSSRLRSYICQYEEHLKRDCPKYNHKKSQGYVRIEDHVSGFRAYGIDCLVDLEAYDGGNILLGDGKECRVRGYIIKRNLISLGTLEKEGFTMKMQSGKIKVIKGSLMVLSGTRRANCVYTLDGQAVTRKTLKGRKHLGEYQTGWKIKTGNVLDSHNQSLVCPRVKCIFLGYRKGIVGNKLWRFDDIMFDPTLDRFLLPVKDGE